MVLLAYDLAELNTEGVAKLLPERVIDMLLGCAMALVGTAAALPRQAVAEIDSLAAETPAREGAGRDKQEAASGDDGSG